jgi:hypothetical protein
MATWVTCTTCDATFLSEVDSPQSLVCPTCGTRVSPIRRASLDISPSPSAALPLTPPKPKKRSRNNRRKTSKRNVMEVFSYYGLCLFLCIVVIYIRSLIESNAKYSAGFFVLCISGVCFRHGQSLQAQWEVDQQIVLKPAIWIPTGLIVMLFLWIVCSVWAPLYLLCMIVLTVALWCVLHYEVVLHRVGLAEISLILCICVSAMIFFDSGPSYRGPSPGFSIGSVIKAPDQPRVVEPIAEAEGPGQPRRFVPEPIPKNWSANPHLNKPGTYYLSDLNEFAFLPGPAGGWTFGKDGELGDPSHSRIKVNGRGFPKGLGMHPPDPSKYTRICYALSRRARQLKGTVALDDSNQAGAPVRFEIHGDGRNLWKSSPIQKTGGVQSFDLDVSGVEVLQLWVYVEGRSNHGCSAVWLDPLVVVP